MSSFILLHLCMLLLIMLILHAKPYLFRFLTIHPSDKYSTHFIFSRHKIKMYALW